MISYVFAVMMMLTFMTFMPKGILRAAAFTGTGTKPAPFVATTYEDLLDIFRTIRTDDLMELSYVKLGANIESRDLKNDCNFALTKFFSDTPTKNVHFDLAGYTSAKTDDWHLFDTVAWGNSLEIDDSVGGGKIMCCLDNSADETSSLFYVAGNAELTINGGTFISPHSCITQDDSSKLVIKGGEFIHTTPVDDPQLYSALELNGSKETRIYNCTVEGNYKDIGIADFPEDKGYLFNEKTNVKADGNNVPRSEIGQNIKGRKITFSTNCIDRIDIKVNRPKKGELFDRTAVTDSPDAELPKGVEWYYENSKIDETSKYDGLSYTAKVTVKATGDKFITKDTDIYINDKLTIKSGDYLTGVVTCSTWDLPETDVTVIPQVIMSLNEEKDLKRLELYAEHHNEFHIEVISWEKDGSVMPSKDRYTELSYGSKYRVKFIIYANDDFGFDTNGDFTATINGLPVESIKPNYISPFSGYTKSFKVVYNFKIDDAGNIIPLEDDGHGFDKDIPEFMPEIYTGDINSDLKVDIEDAVMIINHIVGAKSLSEYELTIADIDNDKDVDIEDAVAIISHVNGIKALY